MSIKWDQEYGPRLKPVADYTGFCWGNVPYRTKVTTLFEIEDGEYVCPAGYFFVRGERYEPFVYDPASKRWVGDAYTGTKWVREYVDEKDVLGALLNIYKEDPEIRQFLLFTILGVNSGP